MFNDKPMPRVTLTSARKLILASLLLVVGCDEPKAEQPKIERSVKVKVDRGRVDIRIHRLPPNEESINWSLQN